MPLTIEIGDITNLIGCILTHQLPFQVSSSQSLKCLAPLIWTSPDFSCGLLLYNRRNTFEPVLLLPPKSDSISPDPSLWLCYFIRFTSPSLFKLSSHRAFGQDSFDRWKSGDVLFKPCSSQSNKAKEGCLSINLFVFLTPRYLCHYAVC